MSRLNLLFFVPIFQKISELLAIGAHYTIDFYSTSDTSKSGGGVSRLRAFYFINKIERELATAFHGMVAIYKKGFPNIRLFCSLLLRAGRRGGGMDEQLWAGKCN